MVEGGDALGGAKAGGGGFDLKDLSFLVEANEEVAVTGGVLGVDPIEGCAAALLVPLLIFTFLGEQFEGAVARVAEFEGADAGTGFDQL